MSSYGHETALAAALTKTLTRTGVRAWRGLRLPDPLLGWLLPALLVAVWEILARMGVFPPNWLPAPSVVATTIFDLARQGELLGHIGITLWRIAAGFLLGAIAATLFGTLTGYLPLARKLLDPLLQALRNIPSMAWVPLFLLWLGVQESSKVSLIAVGVFFPVYLNLYSGILQVDRKLLEVGRIFQLKGIELIRRIVLPATLPAYLVGLRSGLGLGWMFVVAAELMGASRGLGFLMVDGQMTGRAAIIIASIVLFAIFGKLTDLLLESVGRRWQRRAHPVGKERRRAGI
ncbi:ABC transporter permease [Desulfuromonas carbonis]|uniref:ABC transporter permease n=1 Tax=Desulfuromonas sp. DDH964 TaxID=1823759 RepID=UPI00078B8C7E|nr:ABC transporter permease [Desulfuromonas sp. DDH964]AMV70546.1 Putative aliphatic sulfonates transport permease protein SsuC [Desulfuromonas sp. DDH964]